MVKMLLNKSQYEYMPVSTNLNLSSLQLSCAQGHINWWSSCIAWYFKATEFYVYMSCLLTDIFVVHSNVLRKCFSSILSRAVIQHNAWICTAGKLWWSCRRIIKEAIFMNSFEHEICVITVEQCTENTASLVQIPAGKCNWGNNYCLLQKLFETWHIHCWQNRVYNLKAHGTYSNNCIWSVKWDCRYIYLHISLNH